MHLFLKIVIGVLATLVCLAVGVIQGMNDMIGRLQQRD